MSKKSAVVSQPPIDANVSKYKYCKDQHEHILKVPDTYMGSINSNVIKINTFLEGSEIITNEEQMINEGLYKIFDEILVNASDNSIRSINCTSIKVNIGDDGIIEVCNNGDTIPIVIHDELNIYIPEMIFSKLLTSENYDTKDKIVGGKNGYGAKLTNIYSKYFEIEIVNPEYKKQYNQIFRDNMYCVEPPVIVKSSSKISYTKIKFLPDYEKFGMTTLTTEMKNLFKRRTYDIAGTSNKAMDVYFNDVLIPIKNFEDYMKMYYEEMPPYVYQKVNERWSVGIVYDPSKEHRAVSFVNRISTNDGGTHVNYIKDQLIKKISEEIKTKHKKLTIKPSTISESLTIYVNTTIEDPDFGSQSKDTLKTKASLFRVKCELDDKFIKKICKTGLLDDIIQTLEAKQEGELKKKTDSSKRDNLREILKLCDAEWAGTKKANECCLIITEGDSAKALVLSGNPNPKTFGIFPLKGKPLNAREATTKQLIDNEELINLKKILGLTQDTKNTDKLRYGGGIIVLADADVDGIHIKGLILNLFHRFWRDLLPLNYVKTLPTPIIKANRKKDKKIENAIEFYSLSDYEKWVKEIGTKANLYDIKYYKGLGTYTKEEAKIIFKDFENKIISWGCCPDDEVKKDNITDNAVILAFDKKHANARKEWVKCCDPDSCPTVTNNVMRIDDFINNELIHFSVADNVRSIPNLYDGLKVSQRKVLFSAFKRKLENSEVKVSQFAGYISEHSEYHHGEASLFSTIIGMAQDYWCSNNINLFLPNGQFGTRLEGGKDSASPRYIFTQLNSLTKYIFRSEDESILKYINEEGTIVEPETYYPIIPMALINHIEGIGTGYSTNIPSYNPLDVINNVRAFLENKKLKPLIPWIKFFKGDIVKSEGKTKSEFVVYGKYTQLDENTLKITELPLEVWTINYKAFLEKIVNPLDENDKSSYVKDYKDTRSDKFVNIDIIFYNGKLQKLLKEAETDPRAIEKELKLKSSISTNNMHLWKNNIITKYATPNDILKDFAEVRLIKYEERRQHIIKILEAEMLILKYTKKYIEQVLKGEIVVMKQLQSAIIASLEKNEYPKLSANADEGTPSYNYLIKLRIWNLTFEEIEEINKKYDLKMEELNYYLNSTPKELWLKDLTEFENAYVIWYAEQVAEYEDEPIAKPAKKSKVNKAKK